MEQKVLSFIKQNNLINDESIVCAISGGVDSICLLNILYKLGYKLILAHVNHNKREQSIVEQKAMEQLAKKLNIPFELLDYHFEATDNFHNDSHNARYNFFKQICDKYDTNVIATAHHLDDQLETILIKLMDGSNLYGYGGISYSYFDGKYKVIRPLLCTNKDELYKYAKTNFLNFFEDSSNNEDVFLRNRIRHNVIPLLKEECCDIYNKVSQFSLQLKEAFDYIRKQSIEYLEKNNNIIRLESFNDLDVALKKDIISLLLENYKIRKNNQIILDILNILADESGTKTIHLEGEYVLIRSYKSCYIEKTKTTAYIEEKLELGNKVFFNNKYRVYFSKKIPDSNAKYIKLCYNTLKLPFVVRNKRNGDEINLPIGNKKVSRVFIDHKVPANVRDNIPIILDSSNNILWVYDYVKAKEVIDQKNIGDIYLVCEEV